MLLTFYSSNVNHQGDGVEEVFENIAFLLINLFMDFEPSLEPPRPEFLKEFLLCSSSSPIQKGVIPASLILIPPTSSCWATSIASSLLPANTAPLNPNSEPFAISIASFKLVKDMIGIIGPNVSSFDIFIALFTFDRIVGRHHLPPPKFSISPPQ